MARWTRPTILRPHLCGCEVVFVLDDDLDGAARAASVTLVEMHRVCDDHHHLHGHDHDAVHAAIVDEGDQLNRAIEVLAGHGFAPVDVVDAASMDTARTLVIALRVPAAARARLATVRFR